jgi:hypothetical protein
MITTYAELKSQVADWLHRTDLTTNIPTFIQLAESKIDNSIKGRKLETVLTTTLTAGVNLLALPADYSSMKSIVVLSNPTSTLELIPDHVLSQYNSTNTTGVPQFYSIRADNIIFSLPPDGSYSIQVTYYANLTKLSDSNTTNWVLTRFPYLYLYGALIEASIFSNDPDQVQFYQTKFDDGIRDVITKFGDESWSGSPLRSKSDYVV